MELTGSGATVSTISLVMEQPLTCTAVNRSVALEEATRAVVTNECGASMVAAPETTVHSVEAIGERPGMAVPFKAKAVEAPSMQRV
jgi:hypothetical protein